MSAEVEILSTSEARKQLPTLLRQFGEQGDHADPVLVGAHRRPTGVLMSYSSYRALLDYLDDLAIAETVKKRLAKKSDRSLTLDELVAAVEQLERA